MQFFRIDALKALPVLAFLAAYAGAAFGVAGNVQFVIGDVKAINRAGETRVLQKGAAIDEGDRIVTADGASAQIKMVDGGFIAVRPNTDMGFDTYRYAGKEDGTENAAISLLRGGFRTITGLIGRTNKQNYLVKTATATIGIRGTDHEPMVILAPAPGQAAIAAPGTYDKVNVGIAFIRTDVGSVDIHRNQVGFAPDAKTLPLVLPKIPPFYKPTPAPGPQKAKEEPKDEGKKDSQQTAATAPAKAAEEQKAAEAPAPIRNTAVVDPTSTVTSAPAATTVAAPPVTVAPVVAVTATDTSGSTVNTTTQTVTSSTGATVPLSEGAFALQAQTAADAAAASAAALNTLLTAAGSAAASATASSAVTAAQSAVTSASTAASSIAALTIDAGLAASNAAAAVSLATAASGQVSAATTKFNANGTFADPTIAVPAFAALNAANAALQTASGTAQSAAGTATAQNSTLTSAQSAASAALSTANQALTAANTAMSALTAAGISTSSSASSLLSAAQTAASTAQSAATQAKTLQSAGDFTGAQAQLTIAQQQALTAANALAAASQVLTAVASANSAQTAAASITAASTGLLSATTTAQSAGASAVGTTSTQLATAQAQAPIVQQNAPLAQYSNPAVASGNFTEGLMSMKPVTGGVESIDNTSKIARANTNYVLDGNMNLVEIRNIGYERRGWNYTSAMINNADITFSGGTAKDQASDPSGVYYFGRWQGGQVNIKDLATTGAVAPFSDVLGPTSAHWIVGLLPGNSTLPSTAGGPINNMQQIVGTANYSLAAATHPTDSLGNVGTLSSATLAANFSSQTVNAALGLSFSSADAVNVSTRNLSISASVNNVPIQSAAFDASTGTPYAPVINCTSTSGGCAAAGYVGDIGGRFLSTASAGSTTGAVGTGVGLGYSFAPSIASAPANQPLTDLIQGVAVLSTSAAPTVGVTNFSSTAVLRDDVLWPTTQIATGVNPTTTTYIVSDKNKENLFNNSSGTPSTPLTTPLTTPVTLTGPTSNTNFLFDSSGNLVRVFDTPHVVFDLGNDVPGSSTQFAAPTPLAHAQLSFGGSGATSESYFDSATNVRLGRWTGGVVNVTDLTTGASYIDPLVGPGGAPRSVQWVVAQSPSSLPVTGEFQYTRINGTSGASSFATAPTDSYGNVGTLQAARVSADFTNMRASAGVRISMPSGVAGSLGIQNLSSHFENAPISGGTFNVSTGSDNPAGTDSLHVSCFGPGCAPDITLAAGSAVPAYGGRIRGAFDSATGNAGTADGAFFRYTFDTLYGAYGVVPPAGRVVDDYINGLVAFQQGPQIVMPTVANAYSSVTAPTGPVTALTAYSFNNAGSFFTATDRFWVDQPSATNPVTGTPFFVTDTSGNLLSIAEQKDQQHGDGNSLTLSGGTPVPSAPVALAIGSAANATDGTILLGWQQASPALTVTGSNGGNSMGCFDGSAGCPARTVNPDGLSWVRGPAPFPDYLPGAIAGLSNAGGLVVSGTANYTLGSSIVHDQTGTAGSVTAASLGVNFSRQFVDFSMTATTPATGTWTASANQIRMSQSGDFNAYTPPPTSGTNAWTVVTAPQSPTGNISTHDAVLNVSNASLTNVFGNINGQLMGIGLGGAGVTFALNGSPSGCGSSSCNQTVNGALGFTIGGTGPFTTSASQPYSTLTAYQLAAFTTPMVNLSGLNSTQLGQLGNGDLTELSAGIRGGHVSPYRTQVVNNFPVQLDAEFPVVVSQTPPASCTGCTGNTFLNNIPAVYAVTGATGPASIGTATLLESGFDAATGLRWGRYGGGTVGINDRITGASLGTVDLTSQNSHFVLSSVQSGPTVLPLSGTFSYTFVGGTTPTDSNGNVGTALTAANASLTANFSTQKVDAALTNIVVGGNTWGASATGIPISGNFFGADKKLGGGGSLTVTSTLGTNTAGSLGGAFTGATGNGAAMLYSLNHGGNITTNSAAVTVSGVAVFRR